MGAEHSRTLKKQVWPGRVFFAEAAFFPLDRTRTMIRMYGARITVHPGGCQTLIHYRYGSFLKEDAACLAWKSIPVNPMNCLIPIGFQVSFCFAVGRAGAVSGRKATGQ